MLPCCLYILLVVRLSRSLRNRKLYFKICKFLASSHSKYTENGVIDLKLILKKQKIVREKVYLVPFTFHQHNTLLPRPVWRGGAMGAPAPPRRLLRSTFLLKK